jgi:hypothetical protein
MVAAWIGVLWSWFGLVKSASMDGDNAARMVEEDGGGGDPFEDDDSISSEPSFHEENFRGLMMIKENDPSMISFHAHGDDDDDITSKAWARIGRDISNNTHLYELVLTYGTLNEKKMQSLFRGLTRSSSITDMRLTQNEFGAAGVRSMVPFLQNANNLTKLDLDSNNIQSEGFNFLLRALGDSPIEVLDCQSCGIESIEIDSENKPKHLKKLILLGNSINADGCRELAKLLQGEDSTLERLYLQRNKIDDDGVEFLVSALHNNTSLFQLDLSDNEGILMRGRTMLLKLLNDVSSIEATLQSNHRLTIVPVVADTDQDEMYRHVIMSHIDAALEINRRNKEEAGRMKVIQTQLHSGIRAELCRLQGVDQSVFREIDPFLLPEVLSLIGRRHGQGELYIAVLQSIMSLLSTVNVTECIKQERAYHAAKVAEHEAIATEHRIKMEELDAKLVSMGEASEGEGKDDQLEHRSKRRRKWWWGF